MTRIPEQAIEAALEAWYTTPTDYVFETKADGDAKQMLAALTAAIPHLAPKPSQSAQSLAVTDLDEVRWGKTLKSAGLVKRPDGSWGSPLSAAAITAAPPHLVPVQSQSYEAHNFEMEISTVENENGSVNGDDVRRLLSHAYACGATTVRAEATLAGAAAEREACAKVAEDYARWGEHNQPAQVPAREIAAAIRERKT